MSPQEAGGVTDASERDGVEVQETGALDSPTLLPGDWAGVPY